MDDTQRHDPGEKPSDERDLPPPIVLTRRLVRVVVVVLVVVLVFLGAQWLKDRSRSEGQKLGDALGMTCNRVGLIAAFGGRSNLYRCASLDAYGSETSQCDIWVDGAAYDVSKQARALARLQSETPPCCASGAHSLRDYVTTNDVRNLPTEPHETTIGQRPGVVLVPTFHVQDTRRRARFG